MIRLEEFGEPCALQTPRFTFLAGVIMLQIVAPPPIAFQHVVLAAVGRVECHAKSLRHRGARYGVGHAASMRRLPAGQDKRVVAATFWE